MHRRLLLVLVGLALLASAVVGGVVLGRTVLDDEPSEPVSISGAEHGRLVDVCVAAAEENTADCAGFVDAFVGDAEDSGCGYAEVAEMLSWWFAHPGAKDRTVVREWETITEDCPSDV
jgi:hypothetical protein